MFYLSNINKTFLAVPLGSKHIEARYQEASAEQK